MDMTTLAPWISAALALTTAIGCILLGYWMGRNSIELPMRSDNNPAIRDQGSTEDPGGDPYEAAMAEPDEARRPTIGR